MVSGWLPVRRRAVPRPSLHGQAARCSPPDKAGEWLPWVHIAIGNPKAFLLGTYHGVSSKYLQKYLNEREYLLSLLVLALAALFCLGVGVGLATMILLAVAFWDTHRRLVPGSLAGLFLAVGMAAFHSCCRLARFRRAMSRYSDSTCSRAQVVRQATRQPSPVAPSPSRAAPCHPCAWRQPPWSAW